jgi:hypothetical protein
MKNYIEVKTLDDKYVGVRTADTAKAFNKTLKTAGLTAEQVVVYHYFNQRKIHGMVIGDCEKMTGVEFLEKAC